MIRIGVIGCGYWGPNLIRNFDTLPDCEVLMVCDTSAERLDAMKKRYPHIAITQHSDIVINNPEIDAIALCTPVHTHYHLARRCLESKKHTFVEKPLAESTKQCQHLIDLANANHCILMVGHTFLYSLVVQKIKEIIQSGELGDIQYIASRRLNLGLFQKDINCMWDLAPHDISIILYLLEKSPITINCQGKAHVTDDIEDVINLTMDFNNGCFASIHNSWLDPNKVREMTLVGTKKMLLYDDTEPLEKIRIYDKHVKNPPYYNSFAEFQFSYHYGDTYSPYIQQKEPLQIECSEFLNSIVTGDKPLTSGENGLEVVRILESATKSLKQNGNKITLLTESVA